MLVMAVQSLTVQFGKRYSCLRFCLQPLSHICSQTPVMQACPAQSLCPCTPWYAVRHSSSQKRKGLVVVSHLKDSRSTHCPNSLPPSIVPGIALEESPCPVHLLDSDSCSCSRSILQPSQGQFHCHRRTSVGTFKPRDRKSEIMVEQQRRGSQCSSRTNGNIMRYHVVSPREAVSIIRPLSLSESLLQHSFESLNHLPKQRMA